MLVPRGNPRYGHGTYGHGTQGLTFWFKKRIFYNISELNKIYTLNELASGDVMFAATGVTNGTFLKGVLIKNNVATTHSVVMRSKTQTMRYVTANHNLLIKMRI